MTRYLASDLHLNHENIIKYCDRPLDDVAEMNRRLIDNRNEEVGSDVGLFSRGDLGLRMEVDSGVSGIFRTPEDILLPNRHTVITF